MTRPLPREELLRRGRTVVLDDQAPEMLEDLRQRGLAIDHWTSTSDPGFTRVESTFYDVMLLDYGGIGARFGEDEGLDVLRYIKRVNPALRVIAFTGKRFDSSKGDFFRLCDGIIVKDSGIREMMEELERHLAEALTPAYHWRALCRALGIQPDSSEARSLEKRLSDAIRRPASRERMIESIKAMSGGAAGKIAEALAAKAVELAGVWATSAFAA